VFLGSKIAPEIHCVFRRLRKQIEKVFGQASLFLNDVSKGGFHGLANLLIPILLEVPFSHLSNHFF